MIGLEASGAPRKKPPLLKRSAIFVVELYRGEWGMWRVHYRRYFKAAARALGLGFVLAFAFFSLWPGPEQKSLALVMKALKDIPLGASPLDLALTLFYHNARASLLAVAAGGLPFLCLPVLDPLVNGAALGLLASASRHHGLNVPLLFLKSVAPHGIVELPAVLYATSAGLYLSVSLGKRILTRLREKRDARHADSSAPPLGTGTSGFIESCPATADREDGSLTASIVRSFVTIVLPLLFIAAFIEAFITPLFH